MFGYGLKSIYDFFLNTYKKHHKLILGVCFVIPLFLLTQNYPTLNFRDFDLLETYGEDLLKSVEKDSIVFSGGDISLYIIWYFQQVKNQRKDIKAINVSLSETYSDQLRHMYPDLLFPSRRGPVSLKDMIKLNYTKHKIYIVGVPGNKMKAAGLMGSEFNLQPRGLLFQVTDKFDENNDDTQLWKSFKFQNTYSSRDAKHSVTKQLIHYYALAHYNKAAVLMLKGMLNRAEQSAKQAIEIDPTFPQFQNLLKMIQKNKTPNVETHYLP